MIKKTDKKAMRLKRHVRVRGKISGTPCRPRLNVFRSNANIYAQIIDDVNGATLVSASTVEKEFEGATGNCEAAKKVGLLYCSAEANSQYQVDEVQKYLEEKGVTVTQYAFSDSNDLSSVCQKAADENDALYVPTDNTVAANTGIVDGICRPAKKPVFAGEEGICAGCGVATLSISYYDLGYTTGEMAVKILNGEADVSTMPIEYTDVTKKYNKTICDDLGLTVPDGYEEIEG